VAKLEIRISKSETISKFKFQRLKNKNLECRIQNVEKKQGKIMKKTGEKE